MVRNTVKNGQSLCSAVICRKRSAFDVKFHLIVVSIVLKACVKDHGRSLQPIARKKGLISMYGSAFVSGFVNILVYFNKLANKISSPPSP